MSSSKRPSLAESLRAAAAGTPAAPPPVPALPSVPAQPDVIPPSARQPKAAPPAPAAEPSAERPAGYYAATRAGKKKVTATLDPPDHKRLKKLAADLELSTEKLLLEAIHDLFAKHQGKGK